MSTRVTLCTVILLALMLAIAVPAFSQTRLIVRQELKHDVSPPVRDLPDIHIPQAGIRVPLLNPSRILGAAANPQLIDPLVAQSELIRREQPALQATVLLKFDGNRDVCCPPDTNGSPGTTQYVETVNVGYAVYDKTTGAIIQSNRKVYSIFNGFGGQCQNGPGISDPVVVWDKAAQRWLISYLAYASNFSSSTECVAISTSADATGSYNRYGFSYGAALGDYPKFAVWPDAYYASYNTFSPGFTGARACAYDRAKMLAGQTATAVCFQRGQADFSLLPSDLDGPTAPPAGSPNYFVELDGLSFTQLDLFKFHVDFVNPNNSTFTGPTKFNIASWKQMIGRVPQPGTSQTLDTLGDRLMFRNAYRNFGDHETLVLSHTVDAGSNKAGVRWYEVRNPAGTPSVFQQGTFQKVPHLWMGSIAQDKNGDIAIGFSVSSTSVFPSVKVTGRVPSDPAGTMQKPKQVGTGTGSQVGTSRWGDYSSMSIDPSDDCTLWFATEYYKTNGTNYSTRIAKFKFNACN